MPHRRGSRDSLREVVRSGWNRVSYRYRPSSDTSDCFGHTETSYRRWLSPILSQLEAGSEVLDLGSGTGDPVARILSARFRVTGVDLSDVQVHRARQLVPRARFVRGDMTDIEFTTHRFGAVTALYSVIHVPRREHRALLRKVARWLSPGGWFLAILGRSSYEGYEAGWLGCDARMFWSHYDATTYRRWLGAEGFRIVREEYVPEGAGGHQMFLAMTERSPQRPTGRGRDGRSGRPARALPRRSRARPLRGARAPPPSP
ncbi:MAG: class I SAM-dependent methyltransferase [Candidatus Lutacidiplasmatales archaeon]